MEAEPGYVGRGWHNDRYERTERAKRFVESGKLPAGEHFYFRDEWMERLTHLVERYNDEPQNGKYCAGLSPGEAYEKHFGEEPLVRLPDAARYLLANERKRLKVGRNGISFRAGRADAPFTYKNADTGALIGKHVEVFFNREAPEVLGVRHPETGEVFAVRRSTFVPAIDADDETLAQAFAENAEHDGYKRALYRAIHPKFSEHFMTRPIFRPTLIDGATADAGRQFAESAEAEKNAAHKERKLHTRTVTAAGQVGLRVRGGRTSETRANAAEELAQLMAEAEQSKPSPGGVAVAGPKTYVLEGATQTALTKQELGIYWSTWNRAEKASPGLDRHAITRRVLGCNKPHDKLTRDEWRNLVSAFSQIAEKSSEP